MSGNNKNKAYKMSLIERLGHRYFQYRGNRINIPPRVDEVHILNSKEQAQLRTIQRNFVLRAGICGAIAAAAAAMISWAAWPLLGQNPDNSSWQETINFWLIVGPATLLITLIEIAYLYYDALRSVHRLSVAAGLKLYSDDEEAAVVTKAMVRAALELPNPPRDNEIGINARNEVSKLRLFLATAIYKLKVTLTNFLLKAIVRRAAGRIGAKVWLEFLSIPVGFFWDAIICWWVIREARIRAMGPSAIKTLTESLIEVHQITDKVAKVIFMAVGSCIVRSIDLHPNHKQLLFALAEKLEIPRKSDLDNSQLFLTQLEELPVSEKKIVLKFLTVGAIIDGKLKSREIRLLKQAWDITGQPFNLVRIKQLKTDFRSGKDISHDILKKLFN